MCEGEKTEPLYFRSIAIEHLRLSTANIKVLPNSKHASDPLSVVNYAIQIYEEEKHDFEQVWCVFDRDRHATYNDALQKINGYRARKHTTFCSAVSNPCFEFWILLHFVYSTAAYHATGTRSPCDNVIRALKEHLPDYNKGTLGNAHVLHERLAAAIAHGSRLEKYCDETESSNPMTEVHRLLLALEEINKKKKAATK